MTDTLATLHSHAVKAVEALEALDLAAPYSDAADQATAAVHALANAARAALFPDVLAPADLAALIDVHIVLLTLPPRPPASLHALHDAHRRAVASSHDTLAALLRSPRVWPWLDDSTRRDYERACSDDLADRDPHARVLAVVVPELEQRITTARETREAHVAAELARREQERREIARRRAQALADRRRRLRAAAARLPGTVLYLVGRDPLSGTQLYHAIATSSPDQLDEIERAMTRMGVLDAEAVETV